MNWILSSFIATISAGLIAVSGKIGEYYYTFASFIATVMFLVCLLILPYNLITGKKILFNIFSSLSGIFFGLTLFFLFRAIKFVNNPGIAVALLRCQCILTLLFGYFLFKYKINVKIILSIIVILIGAFIIVIFENKSKNRDSTIGGGVYELGAIRGSDYKSKELKESFNFNDKMFGGDSKWILYILIAIVFYSLYDIFTKLAVKEINPFSHTLIVVIFSFLVLLLIQIFMERKIGLTTKSENLIERNKYTKYHLLSVLITSLLTCFFLLFLNISILNAPRPSYVKAILVFSMVITTIISKFMVPGAKITIEQWGGMFLVVCGILGLTFS